MKRTDPLSGKLVTLIGGSGFLGKHVAQQLLARGARLRIASRRPERAHSLKPLANLGQIQSVPCDVSKPDTLRAALYGADAAVYLVGGFDGDLDALHESGAAAAAAIAKEMGASAFVLTSAIGADANSEIAYARTKGKGEEAVLAAFPQASVLRPSILFGADDGLIPMLAGLAASFPVLPVFGPDAGLALLHVDDAARAVAAALANPGKFGGKRFELGGPDVLTMMELHEGIVAAQQRERILLPMPDAASALFASLPLTPMSRDQWHLLKAGSIPDPELPGCKTLGITPKPLSMFLDRWMVQYRRHGRFDDRLSGA